MNNPNPGLVVLPFQATIKLTNIHLTFDEVMFLLNKGHRHSSQIKRSYPGAPHTIGWTIFRRTLHAYLYEKEPLFRFEHGARRYIRKAYAIHHSLVSDEPLTRSHIHLQRKKDERLHA